MKNTITKLHSFAKKMAWPVIECMKKNKVPMKAWYTFILSLCAPACIFAQSVLEARNETLGYEMNLEYVSAFEEAIFKSYLEDENIEVISFLVGPDSLQSSENLAEIRASVESIFSKIPAQKIQNKPAKKQVAAIFKEVHEALLDKYVESASFSDIFEKGEYNCVSATALYAYIFDHYGIAYQIKESPNHVYIIADPGVSDIVVESTDPQGSHTRISDDMKEKYVKQLREQKLISGIRSV